MKIKRNGDINFLPAKKLEGEVLKHNGSFTLAEGEVTGHHHVITVPKLDDMTVTKLPDGSYMLELRAEGTVTHPEHSEKVDLKVSPGIYRVGQRREKDWFTLAVRKIVD